MEDKNEQKSYKNMLKIYAIYKKKPFTKGDWFQSDSREFTNYNKCIKEAKKLGGVVLIKRIKTENGCEQIEI